MRTLTKATRLICRHSAANFNPMYSFDYCVFLRLWHPNINPQKISELIPAMPDLIARSAMLLEALANIQKFSGATFVVKYSGVAAGVPACGRAVASCPADGAWRLQERRSFPTSWEIAKLFPGGGTRALYGRRDVCRYAPAFN